jgi:hypothetical protein
MGTADLTSLSRGGGSGGPNQAMATAARGRIEGPPATDADALVVVVPDFSTTFGYQVPSSQWEHASNLPLRGAQCLVIFDDAGDVWVPIWEGMTPGGDIQWPDGGETGEVLGWVGPGSNDVDWVEAIPGPAGPTGATGPKGDTGTTGPTGPSGPGGGPAIAGRAYRNTAFTTVAGTATKLPLDTLDYDSGGGMSVAQGRYNIPSDGYYQVNGQFCLGVGTVSIDLLVGLLIYRNGTEYSAGTRQPRADAQGFATATFADTLHFTAGDYVELYIYANNAWGVYVGGHDYNYLSVSKVSGQGPKGDPGTPGGPPGPTGPTGPTGPSGTGHDLNVVLKGAPDTMYGANAFECVVLTSGPVTIALPGNPAKNDWIVVTSAATSACTITSTKSIYGMLGQPVTSFPLMPFQSVGFRYAGTYWAVTEEAAGGNTVVRCEATWVLFKGAASTTINPVLTLSGQDPVTTWALNGSGGAVVIPKNGVYDVDLIARGDGSGVDYGTVDLWFQRPPGSASAIAQAVQDHSSVGGTLYPYRMYHLRRTMALLAGDWIYPTFYAAGGGVTWMGTSNVGDVMSITRLGDQ